MRPIDANVLHKDILDTITTCRELIANKTQEDARERMEGSVTAFIEVAMRIKDAPTIEAIPIAWILNNERMPKDGVGRDAILDMIEDWRKENADDSD